MFPSMAQRDATDIPGANTEEHAPADNREEVPEPEPEDEEPSPISCEDEDGDLPVPEERGQDNNEPGDGDALEPKERGVEPAEEEFEDDVDKLAEQLEQELRQHEIEEHDHEQDKGLARATTIEDETEIGPAPSNAPNVNAKHGGTNATYARSFYYIMHLMILKGTCLQETWRLD
jgi:hypothetical protein